MSVWEQPKFRTYMQGGPVPKGAPMIFDSEAGCLVPMLYQPKVPVQVPRSMLERFEPRAEDEIHHSMLSAVKAQVAAQQPPPVTVEALVDLVHRVEEERRTILCHPDLEARVQELLDRHGYGMWTVRTSQYLDPHKIYVARTKDLPPETLEASEVLDTD